MNGMAHGRGVETFPDGTVRHDGMWVEDEPIANTTPSTS
jgi:MORN repeat